MDRQIEVEQPVPRRYSISCGPGEFVLVNQAAEKVAAANWGRVGPGIASCDQRVD